MPDPEISLSVSVVRRGSPAPSVSGAFEAKISVTAVEGGEILDNKPFIFQKGVSTATQPEAISYFKAVASVHQISTILGSEPDDLQAQESPYWRSSSTGFLSFRKSDDREAFIRTILSELESLERAAEDVLSGEDSEFYVITGGVAQLD